MEARSCRGGAVFSGGLELRLRPHLLVVVADKAFWLCTYMEEERVALMFLTPAHEMTGGEGRRATARE